MLVRKYLIGAEWLNNIMIILLFFASGEFFSHMLGTTLGAGYLMLSSLIIICMYFGRVYIDKLPLFMLAHVVMYAVLFFAPLILRLKIAAFPMLIVITISDIFFWTGSGVRSYAHVHPLMSLIFAVIFIYASVKDAVYLSDVSYVCGIIFLSLFFLRTYLLNGARFASGMLINKNTPINEMFKHNSRLVFPLVGAFGAGMFLIQSKALADGLSSLVKLVMNAVGRMIFFILSLFPKGREEVQMTVDEQGQFVLPVTTSAPVWLTTLLAAIEKVAALFIIGAFIFFVLKMILRFVRIYFNKHGYEISTVSDEDHTEVRERIKHEPGKGIKRLLAGLSEREKIRRRYRKTVIRFGRRGLMLRREHTPGERLKDVSGTIDAAAYDDFAKLTGQYEEARYNG